MCGVSVYVFVCGSVRANVNECCEFVLCFCVWCGESVCVGVYVFRWCVYCCACVYVCGWLYVCVLLCVFGCVCEGERVFVFVGKGMNGCVYESVVCVCNLFVNVCLCVFVFVCVRLCVYCVCVFVCVCVDLPSCWRMCL